MRIRIPIDSLRDPRDPAYVPFDYDAAFDDACDRADMERDDRE